MLPLRLGRCSLSAASVCLWCDTDVFLPVVSASDWPDWTSTTSSSTLLQKLDRFLGRRGTSVDWQLTALPLSSAVRRALSVLPTGTLRSSAVCGRSPGRETSTTFASIGVTFSTLKSSSPLKTDTDNSCCGSTSRCPSLSTFVAALSFVGVVTSSTVARSTFVSVSGVARHLESSRSTVTAWVHSHDTIRITITFLSYINWHILLFCVQ